MGTFGNMFFGGSSDKERFGGKMIKKQHFVALLASIALVLSGCETTDPVAEAFSSMMEENNVIELFDQVNKNAGAINLPEKEKTDDEDAENPAENTSDDVTSETSDSKDSDKPDESTAENDTQETDTKPSQSTVKTDEEPKEEDKTSTEDTSKEDDKTSADDTSKEEDKTSSDDATKEEDKTSTEDTTKEEDKTSEDDKTSAEDTTKEEDKTSTDDSSKEEDKTSADDATKEEDKTSTEDATKEEDKTSAEDTTQEEDKTSTDDTSKEEDKTSTEDATKEEDKTSTDDTSKEEDKTSTEDATKKEDKTSTDDTSKEEDKTSTDDTSKEEDKTSADDTTKKEDKTSEDDKTSTEDTTKEDDKTSGDDTSKEDDKTSAGDTTKEEEKTSGEETTKEEEVPEKDYSTNNKILMQKVEAARQAAIDAGASSAAKTVWAATEGIYKTEKAAVDTGTKADLSSVLNDLIARYQGLENLAQAKELKEEIDENNFASFRQATYDAGNEIYKNLTNPLSVVQSGADFNQKATTAEADFRLVLKTAYNSLAKDERTAAYNAKLKADSVKAYVSRKDDYTHAVSLYRNGELRRAVDPKTANESYKMSKEEFLKLFEEISAARAQAQKEIDEAKKRVAHSETTAVKADAEAPLGDEPVEGIEDADAKLLKDDDFSDAETAAEIEAPVDESTVGAEQ